MRIVPQLPVFVKNTKGALEHITNVLTKSDINIVGISTHEAFEYGIFRMVVSDPDRAEQELKNAKVPGVIRGDVLQVDLPDNPGELHTTLRKLADNGVNIGYIYASGGKESAIIYMACDDLQKAVETLS